MNRKRCSSLLQKKNCWFTNIEYYLDLWYIMSFQYTDTTYIWKQSFPHDEKRKETCRCSLKRTGSIKVMFAKYWWFTKMPSRYRICSETTITMAQSKLGYLLLLLHHNFHLDPKYRIFFTYNRGFNLSNTLWNIKIES